MTSTPLPLLAAPNHARTRPRIATCAAHNNTPDDVAAPTAEADDAAASPGLARRRILSVADARQLASPSRAGAQTVANARAAFRRILRGEDARVVVIAGPCSVHDTEEALVYATRLRALSAEVEDRVLLMMRVYFEKPRTHVGWKGLLSDPHLDASHALEDGLLLARRLLCELADLGVPAATEFLDPLVTAYLSDLVSWAAIGARTTESQTHRQLASGLPLPIGFKNGTDGGLDVALNAIKAARQPHAYLGIDADGCVGVVETTGNADTHVVLRGAGVGAASRPNHHPAALADLEARLLAAGLPARVLIDCSHANSGYDHRRQGLVADEWITLRREGLGDSAFGLMLESHLHEGKQPFAPRASLRPGVSITDACIGWDDTEAIIRRIHAATRHF